MIIFFQIKNFSYYLRGLTGIFGGLAVAQQQATLFVDAVELTGTRSEDGEIVNGNNSGRLVAETLDPKTESEFEDITRRYYIILLGKP